MSKEEIVEHLQKTIVKIDSIIHERAVEPLWETQSLSAMEEVLFRTICYSVDCLNSLPNKHVDSPTIYVNFNYRGKERD